MRLPTLLSLLLLSACSNDLHALLADTVSGDTAVDVDEPPDTGSTEDTQDTDDTQDTEPVNTAPVADAGPDQQAQVGTVVALDGSASHDPDGDALSYGWVMTTKPPTSSATLINSSHVDPTFWADRDGLYTLELTVDDGLDIATDTVDVTIDMPNDVPVANAGPDQTVSVGDLVQLNGSGSSDPDNDPLTWSWQLVTVPSGSAAYLSDATSALPRFTADASGTYVAKLVVDDGTLSSAPDQVVVVAQSEDDGDCLSCAAARQELQRRMTLGDLAYGPGLVFLPLLVLLWQRTRDEEE